MPRNSKALVYRVRAHRALEFGKKILVLLLICICFKFIWENRANIHKTYKKMSSLQNNKTNAYVFITWANTIIYQLTHPLKFLLFFHVLLQQPLAKYICGIVHVYNLQIINVCILEDASQIFYFKKLITVIKMFRDHCSRNLSFRAPCVSPSTQILSLPTGILLTSLHSSFLFACGSWWPPLAFSSYCCSAQSSSVHIPERGSDWSRL